MWQVVENLSHCTSLQHLDLSDNSIYSLGDVRSLTRLKVSIVMSQIIANQ